MKLPAECSFSNLYDKTSFQIFYDWDCIERLSSDSDQYFQGNVKLPTLAPQITIFGFLIPKAMGLFLKAYSHV